MGGSRTSSGGGRGASGTCGCERRKGGEQKPTDSMRAGPCSWAGKTGVSPAAAWGATRLPTEGEGRSTAHWAPCPAHGASQPIHTVAALLP
eukprot:scaffold3523_cov108-Isochrysis_galbana.AAC.1